MTQTETVYHWTKLNWQKLAIILLLFIVLFQCQGSKTPSIAEKYKNDAQTSKELARQFVKQKNQIIADYDKTIEVLNNRNSTNEKEFAKFKQSQSVKLSQIKYYSTSDIAKYYIDLYNLPNDVKTLSGAVELKDTVSRLVINDLIIGQGVKFENKFLNGKLSIASDKFEVANKTIDTLKITINNISDAYENSLNSKDLQVKEIEKQVRSERRKKNFWKYAMLVGVSGLGYLYVTK